MNATLTLRAADGTTSTLVVPIAMAPAMAGYGSGLFGQGIYPGPAQSRLKSLHQWLCPNR